MRKGNGAMAPGTGIHFVLSEFRVYPELQTMLDGVHAVPD